MKLYIYDHCPFCVKARMIFGLKNLPVELIVMLNDDEETPKRLIGQKIAPILQKEDGSCMPESLDIVRFVDKLDGEPLLTGKTNPAINDWLRNVNGYVNKLLLPRRPLSPSSPRRKRAAILKIKRKPASVTSPS